MQKIVSLNNQKIKWAKKLIFAPKNNDKTQFAVIESKRVFQDLICFKNDNFVCIFVTAIFLEDSVANKMLKTYSQITYIVSDKILKTLSHLKTPEGIVAIVKPKPKKLVIDTKSNYCTLVDLQNPHNLGAIARSCLAFGIKALFLVGNHPNIYHFECIRSSMGYIFELPIKSFAAFEQFALFAKQNHLKLLATSNSVLASNLTSYKSKSGNCFLIGNEGNGLSKQIIAKCDKLLKINVDKVDSLNAAITASIIAFYFSLNNGNN